MGEIFQYIFPPMMLFWIFFIAQGAMVDIYTESEKKTLQRLFVTTATMNQILIAKILRCFLLCFIAEGLLVLITRILFGMEWGNILLLIAVFFCINLNITGMLVCIHALAKTRQLSETITIILLLSLAFFGGGMVPFDELPNFMKSIGEFTPIRWGVLGINGVMHTQSLSNYIRPCLALLIGGMIMGAVGSTILKRRIESGGLV